MKLYFQSLAWLFGRFPWLLGSTVQLSMLWLCIFRRPAPRSVRRRPLADCRLLLCIHRYRGARLPLHRNGPHSSFLRPSVCSSASTNNSSMPRWLAQPQFGLPPSRRPRGNSDFKKQPSRPRFIWGKPGHHQPPAVTSALSHILAQRRCPANLSYSLALPGASGPILLSVLQSLKGWLPTTPDSRTSGPLSRQCF